MVQRLSVVVPAYNEEERILPTLERLAEYYDEQSYDYDVTVVSDGSKDRTGEIVNAFATKHPKFRLLEYHPNQGKGHAVRVGMLAAEGDVVLFCDADEATPQEETAKLLKHIESGYEVAIGSRPLKESKLEKRQPLYREMGGRAFNKVVQLLAVRGIQDTQCGFKIFTRPAAQAVFARCTLNGFSFDIEALMIARDLGFKIAEVPVRWFHREGSKVSYLGDGMKMLKDLVALRLKGKKVRMSVSQTSGL